MTFLRITVASLAAALLLAAGSASAAVVQWDLYGKSWDAPPAHAACITSNCTLGLTASYTASGRTINFAGLSNTR